MPKVVGSKSGETRITAFDILDRVDADGPDYAGVVAGYTESADIWENLGLSFATGEAVFIQLFTCSEGCSIPKEYLF